LIYPHAIWINKLITLTENLDKTREDILNNLPIGIILFDKDGIIQFANNAIRKLEILYPTLFSASLFGKNIFTENIIIERPLTEQLKDLKRGYPFEIEIEELTLPGKANIKLIVKGTPLIEDENFSGGALIIEDLKIISKTQKQFALRSDLLEKATGFITDLLIVIDPNQIIQYITGDTTLIFEGAISYLNHSLLSFIDDKSRTDLDQLISEVKTSKNNLSSKITLTRNEKHKLAKVKLVPQLDSKNQITFIFIFFEDVTLIESEIDGIKKNILQSECYSKVNEAAGQALFSLDANNSVDQWDVNCEMIFGYSAETVRSNFIGNFIDELGDNRLSDIKNSLNDNSSVRLVINHKHGDNKFVECFFTLSSSDEDRLLVLCKDVTVQIKNEKELNKSIKNFSMLLTEADFLVCKTNETGNFIYANKNFCKTFNYTHEELKHKRIYDLIDQSYFEDNIIDLRSAEKTSPLKTELPFKTSEGKLINFSLTVIPEFDNGGAVQYDCFLRSIDEQIEKEKEVKLFLSMLSASNDGISTCQNGKIVFANRAFANIFNYKSEEELTRKDVLDLVSEEDTLKVAEYFRLIERSKENVPYRFNFLGRKTDGSLFHVEISAGTFSFENKTHIVMVVRDVSEIIRAQKAIRESEEKYRNITENIDDFLFTFERIRTSLRPVFCTTSVQKITGYTQTDFLADGKLFFKIIHPDDFQIFKPKLMNLLKSRIQNSGEFEFRIINKHGNIVWVRTKLNLVRIGAGRIQKVYGLVSDVTFRKRAEEELKKSTQNLIKLNETKDRFISIVSHDLRTPFSSILGFTDLLINDKDLTEDEKKQYILYIQESSHSMLALVNSLLDWTRLQTGRIKFEPQKLDAVQIIEDSQKTLSGISMQKGIEIINLTKGEKLVFADKSLLIQVFNNLVSNAIKFTKHGGKIYISSSAFENPRFIEFSVRDTGVGIKEENLQKLFSIESKFTSEGTAGEKGSGLGLSLVKEIIELHGGKISVTSNFGEGTDFRITLPIASAKILIVDDNKTDRLLYSKILKNITPDYDVEIASNGKEALEKIKLTHPALVITDHSMPVMNGYEFVIELQKLEMKGKPPVIVLSSDIDRNAINDYNEVGIEFVFHKPVNLGHFKQAVEKSLRKSFSDN
jgi:PAS domain S-box-containing protein